MDTLLSILKEKDLKTITDEVHSFFLNSGEHPNKLKLSIATAAIIEEAHAVLASIDYENYLKDLRLKLDSLSEMAAEEQKKHIAHLELNSCVLSDLGEVNNQNLRSRLAHIERELQELDEGLKEVIQIRDKLPMAQIVENQKA